MLKVQYLCVYSLCLITANQQRTYTRILKSHLCVEDPGHLKLLLILPNGSVNLESEHTTEVNFCRDSNPQPLDPVDSDPVDSDPLDSVEALVFIIIGRSCS